jgi:hypothetical protein
MTALDDPTTTPTTTPATPPPATVPPPPAPVPAVGEQSTKVLVADIADDAGSLVTDTANLLHAELRDGVKETGGWAMATAAGVVLLTIGVLFALISGVYALNANVPSLPLWACWLIVGGCMLVVGGILSALGVNRLSRVNLVPTRTLKSLSESWSWLVKRSK